jgi:hypothetical protein
METGGEPSWVALRDEELLNVRICDLGVRIEGSELEKRVREFHDELAGRGVTFRPDCYLGDEWFSPEGVPAIAIPFYLAHPRLKSLEMHQMLEVEGGTAGSCQMLLRHECGHAIDHAYRFSSRKDWRGIFGSPDAEYTPKHISRIRTAEASSATCRTGTRNRIRTRISPRLSQCGWGPRRTSGGNDIEDGRRWRNWNSSTR